MPENCSETDIKNPTCRVLKLKGCYYGNNCMPSLNNLLAEAMRHPMAYSKLKKQLEFVVINAIRLQLKGYKATKQVQLHFEFGERDKHPFFRPTEWRFWCRKNHDKRGGSDQSNRRE